MSFTVKMVGDWDKAYKATRPKNLKRAIVKAMVPAFEEAATLVANNINRKIMSGGAQGPPLARSTILRKGHSKKLVRTGALGQAAKVRRIGVSEFFTGIPRDLKHGRLAMATLIMFQEEGTSTIPPRPVVQPSINESERRVKNVLGKAAKTIWGEI